MLKERAKQLGDISLFFENKYMHMERYVADATREFVDSKPLFEYPVSKDSIVGILKTGEFEGDTAELMHRKLSEIPLNHVYLLQCQQKLFDAYNSCLQFQWVERIMHEVRKCVE